MRDSSLIAEVSYVNDFKEFFGNHHEKAPSHCPRLTGP